MMPYETLNSTLNHAAGYDGRKQFSGGAFKLPIAPDLVQRLFDDFSAFITTKEGMAGSLMLWETIPYTQTIKVSNDKMAFSNRGEYYNLATMLKW